MVESSVDSAIRIFGVKYFSLIFSLEMRVNSAPSVNGNSCSKLIVNFKKVLEKESEVVPSCPTLCDSVDSRSMEFSRQEYWSRLPFPSPRDLPDPGIEPRSSTLQADTLPSEPPGKPKKVLST